MITREQLAELRRLERKALKEGWQTRPGERTCVFSVMAQKIVCIAVRPEDAEFLTAMRNALPDLLDFAEQALKDV